MVRDFVAAEVSPVAGHWGDTLPREIIATLGGLGLLGIDVDEAYGGAGMGALAAAVALEELAAGDGGLALAVATHAVLCCGHIERFGTETQKRLYLPDLMSGTVVGTWAGGASESGSLTARALRSEIGWRLEGSLPLVTQVRGADLAVVVVATGPERATAFVLPSSSWASGESRTLGLRSAAAGELLLGRADVDDVQRIGRLGTGHEDEASVLTRGHIGRAAIAVGIARAAAETAVKYATERSQFGKPIARFQAIQWMIADSATEVDAARLMCHRAAAIADAGDDASTEAAMARRFASRVAREVTDRAVQIHGGYGYTTEYPVERYWRDAKQIAVGEGTNDALQRQSVARGLLDAPPQ
jgi:alkylation response protein AidB-like acyl-CoA dehydrogenase